MARLIKSGANKRHPIVSLAVFPLLMTIKFVPLFPVAVAMYAVIIPFLLVVGAVRLVSWLSSCPWRQCARCKLVG